MLSCGGATARNAARHVTAKGITTSPAAPLQQKTPDTFDQSASRAELARLYQQYAKLSKPDIWRMLMDFGFGMAASPSHFASVAIGQGGQAMAQGMAAREYEARKAQLELLGVSRSLDNEARLHQEKLLEVNQRATNQG